MAPPRFYTPLLYPLVGAIGGIIIQSYLPFSWPLLGTGIIVTMVLIAILIWRKEIRWLPLFFVLCFGCLGGLMLSLHNAYQQHLHQALGGQPLQCLATVIDDDPWGDDGKGRLLRVTVSEVFPYMTASHQFLSFDLLCYSRFPLSVAVGDTVLLRNVVIKQVFSVHNDKPGYQEYLAKEGVVAAIFLNSFYQCRTVARPAMSIRRWLWELRDRIYTAFRTKLAPLTQHYVGLIFLGNKQQPQIEALRDVFCQWGLAHYLARAGLHIVLFIMIWTFLLRLIPIHITIKRWLMILLCVLYDLLSWSSIPFARAYYAFLLTQFGQWRNHQTNFLHFLTGICLIILVFNPLQLFFLDFQLTFALTFALVFFAYYSTT